VFFYGSAGNEERFCHGLVGAALGYEGENLSLAGGERREAPAATGSPPCAQNW
jgi:hypothetical protein